MRQLYVIIALFVILCSGCATVEVTEQLKPQGEYNLIMDLTVPAENLVTLRENLQLVPGLEGIAEVTSTDSSLRVAFFGLSYGQPRNFFRNTSFGDPDGLLPRVDYLGQELHFPYYIHTYEYHVVPALFSNPTGGVLSAEKYIEDEINLLDSSQEDLIVERMNRMFQNDSIELLVVTKPMVNYDEFQPEFIQQFDFVTKRYVMLFVSRNATASICMIDTNLFFGEAVPLEITSLGARFAENCSRNLSKNIMDVTEHLDQLFIQQDIIVLDAEEQGIDFSNLPSIQYTVDLFGDVTDTNGEVLDRRRVRFDIDPAVEMGYRVQFREFILASYFGKNYIWYVGLICLLLLFLMIIVLATRIREYLRPRERPMPDGPNPQALVYVRRGRMCGISDEEISRRLIAAGWSKADVDKALQML